MLRKVEEQYIKQEAVILLLYTYSFGGAVYVLGTNSSISVFDSHFINNTAMTEGGGAIYSNGQYANVTLTSSTFHNNSASYCVLDVDNYNHFSVS